MEKRFEARIVDGPAAVTLEVEGRIDEVSPKNLGRFIAGIPAPQGKPVLIDLERVEPFGGLGIVTLNALVKQLEERGHQVQLRVDAAGRHAIECYGRTPVPPEEPGGRAIDLIDRLGERTIRLQESSVRFILLFVKAMRLAILQSVGRKTPRHDLVIPSILRMGAHATPLVALIAGLIGIILALHAAPLLRQYGQELRVADLVGLAMTKEIGPLLTAILVAGRSGSSLTAEIGTMKVSEEIDALEVMGVSPIGFLVAPRLRAMVVVLPVLTIIADVVGIGGGLGIGALLLDIPREAYLDQTLVAVHLRDIVLGLLKAFAFALVIVTIASYQGFRTAGGAAGVGKFTTRSVVQSIIWIIIVDAVFTAVDYAVI